MSQFSLQWRRRAAQTLGLLGEQILELQEGLQKLGHGAFLPDQAELKALAESEDELAEFDTYLKEAAKEIIGSIWNAGGVDRFSSSDGFVSSYLQSLRQRRDREVGTRDDYRRLSSGWWRFEINKLAGRLNRLKELDKAAHQKIRDATDAQAQSIKSQEGQAVFPVHEDEFEFYFDIKRRMECVWEGIRVADVGFVTAKDTSNIKPYVPLVGVPIGGAYTFCMCVTDTRSLQNPADLCILDQSLFLMRGDPEGVVGRPVKDRSRIHELRIDRAIYGFHRYHVARSLSEVVLGICVPLRLMKLVVPALQAGMASWEDKLLEEE